MADGRSPNSGPKNKYLGLTAEAWGVIGAVAAVAAVLLALLPHFGNNDSTSGSANSPAASSPGFSRASAGSSGIPPVSIPSASTQGFARQWGPGTLLITSNYTDLDSVPPNVNSGNPDVDISGGKLEDENHLVAWSSAKMPTARECADLISTQGLTDLKPTEQGEVICAATDMKNIAVLVIKRIDVDSDDNITDTLVQATVWSNNG